LIALLALSNIGWLVVYRFMYLGMKQSVKTEYEFSQFESKQASECMDARAKLFNDLVACEAAARQK